MRKIIIGISPETASDEGLNKWLKALFPECEIITLCLDAEKSDVVLHASASGGFEGDERNGGNRQNH